MTRHLVVSAVSRLCCVPCFVGAAGTDGDGFWRTWGRFAAECTASSVSCLLFTYFCGCRFSFVHHCQREAIADVE